MPGPPLKRTPLYDRHVEAGARMVDFVGWEMPLLYRGIIEEHRHTRAAASIFDVSHMGRIEIRGRDAEAMLEYVCTRRLGDMQPGQSRYSHVCGESGGILDDVIVSRYDDRWLLVCNACNHARIAAWLAKNAHGRSVELEDITDQTAMIAVQGPRTMAQAAARVPVPLSDLRRYRFRTGTYLGTPFTIFRTGYTGEDGVEVIVPASAASVVWTFLTQPHDDFEPPTVQPAGLGARDTLRIEAGLPLYGHELHEHVDPITAGFAWCVDLEKDFCGAAAVRAVARQGAARRLVGLELAGRRIARQHGTVRAGGRVVGEVTSGTFAPTLGRSIAMAYVEVGHDRPGTSLAVRIGEHEEPATVVALPFYRRDRGTEG